MWIQIRLETLVVQFNEMNLIILYRLKFNSKIIFMQWFAKNEEKKLANGFIEVNERLI